MASTIYHSKSTNLDTKLYDLALASGLNTESAKKLRNPDSEFSGVHELLQQFRSERSDGATLPNLIHILKQHKLIDAARALERKYLSTKPASTVAADRIVTCPTLAPPQAYYNIDTGSGEARFETSNGVSQKDTEYSSVIEGKSASNTRFIAKVGKMIKEHPHLAMIFGIIAILSIAGCAISIPLAVKRDKPTDSKPQETKMSTGNLGFYTTLSTVVYHTDRNVALEPVDFPNSMSIDYISYSQVEAFINETCQRPNIITAFIKIVENAAARTKWTCRSKISEEGNGILIYVSGPFACSSTKNVIKKFKSCDIRMEMFNSTSMLCTDQSGSYESCGEISDKTICGWFSQE